MNTLEQQSFIELVKQFKKTKENELLDVEEFTETYDVLTGAIETCQYFLDKLEEEN
jgi:hypothetical protein